MIPIYLQFVNLPYVSQCSKFKFILTPELSEFDFIRKQLHVSSILGFNFKTKLQDVVYDPKIKFLNLLQLQYNTVNNEGQI